MRNESSNKKEVSTSHKGHMWLMAIFCGLAIIGFLAVGAPSVSLPSLELALLVICAIGMTGMMYMMNRSSREQSKNVVGEKSDLAPGSLIYAKKSADVDQVRISQAKKSTRKFDA